MNRIVPLIDRLPKVEGRYTPDAPLKNITWFQVGGPAEVVFKPASTEDLSFFLKNKPKDVAVNVIGVGSNLLARDGGVEGVTIRLGKGFNSIHIDPETCLIDVGAGFLDRNLALMAKENGIGNLEFLCGIPGTIGGALRMNAGAYGMEIKDILQFAIALKPDGTAIKLTPQDMGFSYRHCSIPDDWIFIGAQFRGVKGDSQEIGRTITKLLADRDNSQPVKTRTGGSTFANPEGAKAWELIDKAGCRGLKAGGAQVSEMHCNFLINTGTATADDLETLGETVREKVKRTSGVDLRWEIQRIGKKKGEETI